MLYLTQRQTELEKEGGKDSLIYKREAKIIPDAIARYKLLVSSATTPKVSQSVTPVDRPPQQNHVFCTNCGTKNPTNSKFCFKCGNKLVSL